MGGEISVSSVMGSGSRFTVTLPRATQPPRPASRPTDGVPAGTTPSAVVGPPAPAAIPARHRVLVVEDNEDNLFTLREVLARLPLEIVPASTGREAIEICRRELPELVIMDMQMPGMSGLQTTGAIRALPGGAGVPIVALTAQAMRGDRERILAAGCDEYLSKPVQPRALIEITKRLLARNGAEAGGTANTNAKANAREAASNGGEGAAPDGTHSPRR
jgi:CheY-like chemotaxis protein